MTPDVLWSIEQSIVAYDADELVFPCGTIEGFRSALVEDAALPVPMCPRAAAIATSECVTDDFCDHPWFVEYRKGGTTCGRMKIT